MRRNVYLPEPDWKRLKKLAALEGARLGRTVSPSEYLRMLIDRDTWAAGAAVKKQK